MSIITQRPEVRAQNPEVRAQNPEASKGDFIGKIQQQANQNPKSNVQNPSKTSKIQNPTSGKTY